MIDKSILKTSVILILVLLINVSRLLSQPFLEDISAFKIKDAIKFPQEKSILFIGSSSFTLWKDIESYFPNENVINRGFGGSSIIDLIRYENEIIFPYNPAIIVIYCGENDIAGDEKVDGKVVYERFIKLHADIRAKLFDIPIIYISMKPSPARWHLQDKYSTGNQLIAEYLEMYPNNYYLDMWTLMLDENNMPKEELFIEDKLHINRAGYEIWADALNNIFSEIRK
jgi:lysophospholipase L1-like esterase